jgi:hypothetical protein
MNGLHQRQAGDAVAGRLSFVGAVDISSSDATSDPPDLQYRSSRRLPDYDFASSR